MDINATGEVRGQSVVHPVVVREPGVLGGGGDQVACAFVRDAVGLFFSSSPRRGHAVSGLRGVVGLGFDGRVVDVNVSDLMIGHGKCLAVPRSLVVPVEFLLDGDPALLAEQTVEMNWLIDRSDSVFRKQDDPDAA